VTVTSTIGEITEHVRSVTADEISFYRENGWVKLEKLISREMADRLHRGIEAVIDVRQGQVTHAKVDSAYVTAEQNGISGVNFRESDEFIAQLAHSTALGNIAGELIGVRPLRLWSDSVFGKPGGGLDTRGTAWHQDYPSLPIDRATGGSIWIAAVEILPEMGSLQYMSGSHRERPLGRVFDTPNGAVDYYPWLTEKYSVSPAFHLQPGDALAHNCLTMHSAQPNKTDRTRFAWASLRFDANALYTGLANDRSDGRGLEVSKVFDHPFFPIVTD
jgi:ectoine hydroxylase-related dioxygenase (phytanoyl-CoA dioxygenase family)